MKIHKCCEWAVKLGSVTFHGGVNSIGGNKFLVQSGTTRIFLDFGNNFSAECEFFELLIMTFENGCRLRELSYV